MLTQLDGSPVWVESTAVQIVKTRGNECGPGVGSVILVGARALCVKEKEEQVRSKINEGKR
jgi:uncharacterized protein YlzI (FlbEa/FlbD family)